MRWIILFIMITTSLALAGQSNNITIEQLFAKNQIVTHKYFAQNKSDDELSGPPLSGDIYEFDAKSTKRAFFYSLAVPGAGEYYAGSRIKPAVFLGVEATLWIGYFVYNGKGKDKQKEFIQFADDHYRYDIFNDWWLVLDTTTQNKYSHRLKWNNVLNRPIFDREYYENIGKYSEFQVGWDDIGTGHPPPGIPEGGDYMSPNRLHYLELRRKSNDYFQNASTSLILILGNHIISAFDAALTAKSYNKGQKRFSIMLKAKKMGNTQIPMLTYDYIF